MITGTSAEWETQNGLGVRKSRFTSQIYLVRPFSLWDSCCFISSSLSPRALLHHFFTSPDWSLLWFCHCSLQTSPGFLILKQSINKVKSLCLTLGPSPSCLAPNFIKEEPSCPKFMCSVHCWYEVWLPTSMFSWICWLKGHLWPPKCYTQSMTYVQLLSPHLLQH